jgi:hypothetical protein
LRILLQSVDLTEMAKEGKLDPTIGRDEGMYMLAIPSSNLIRFYYFQKFEERFKVSFQLLCWLLLPRKLYHAIS